MQLHSSAIAVRPLWRREPFSSLYVDFAVQEGTHHCYEVAVKVTWKIVYTNTFQSNSHLRTQSNFHLRRKRRAAWCSLQMAAPRELQDAVQCPESNQTSCLPLRHFSSIWKMFPVSNQGSFLALRKDFHPLFMVWGEDTEPHRLLWCPFAVVSTVLDAV